MSDETDYEALEKSVKYIPWKGKKNRMVHAAQDFLGMGNDTWLSWHTGRIGCNSIWWHGKEACNVDWTDFKPKVTIQQLQNEHVCRPTTKLHSRHCILWKCGHGERWGSDEWHHGTGMEMTVWKICWKKWNWLSNWMRHEWKKWRSWRMDYKFGMSVTENCRMWKNNWQQWADHAHTV